MSATSAILAEVTVSNTWATIALLAIVAQAILLVNALFGGLKYKIRNRDIEIDDDEHFMQIIESLTDAKMNRHTSLEVLTNGEQFYEAELRDIAAARQTVHLEAYIFQTGEIMRRYVDALTERASAGVKVRVVLDGLGSAGTTEKDMRPLLDAGGQVVWYHALRFKSLPNYNNRTHREILIVDGRVGYIGGAGVADHWYKGTKKQQRWRDTMVRIQGDAVSNLQATFAENWLESCGELLFDGGAFPKCEEIGTTPTMVITSTPSAGGSTRARVLFQSLLASAEKSIYITTPYFLPDGGIQQELVRAQQRGVDVRILVPGKHNDHLLTRSSSRLAYGRLLKHAIRVWEYQPTMIHAKVLIIDGEWVVMGSTNFDNRSFGINDEVNIAVRDPRVADRLEQDFRNDLQQSREITYKQWKSRSLFERGPELVGWILERQQ